MATRIFLKVILALLLLLASAVVVAEVLVWRVVESSYIETLESRMEGDCRMLVRAAAANPSLLRRDELAAAAALLGMRLTVIARDGTVLEDSEGDPSGMENHRHRAEVAEALAGRVGRSLRFSPTVGAPFLYVAIPSPAGVLRAAAPLSDIQSRLRGLRARMIKAIALALPPVILVAAFLSRRFAARMGAIIEFSAALARGNFQARLPEQGGPEFRALIRQLNQTGEKLQKMVEQLRREHAELERLERIRRDFVINVSHELRTPVASIQGYAETLLDGALEDPQHNLRFLTIIRQNAERLGRLTEDLLTLSGLELRTREFSFASYRLEPLLAHSLDVMRPIAARKDIVLELEQPCEPAEVFCDAEAVHQILSNLLENAIKYSPEGSCVRVGARLAFGGACAEVCVRDQGPGIPPEELPRLFERFYRVDKARSRELGGTGLGLAIVKHLALAQGGNTRVESQLGQGSSFYFTLPREEAGLGSAPRPHREFTVL